MIYKKFILILLAFVIASCNENTGYVNKNSYSQGNTSIENIGDRTYRLYKPSSLPSGNAPVLLALHGAYGNAKFIEDNLELNKYADKYGFIIAYPNGTEGITFLMKGKRFWNSGNCCGVANRRNVDDVLFLERVINDLVKHHNVDSKRVYLTGHSNGSMMSYRFVCEKPDMVAAMVGMAGPLTMNRCRNAQGVKILHIHGARDEFVPSSGGLSGKTRNKLKYKSIYQNRKELEQSGANVEVKELANTGHHLQDLKQGTKNNYSVPLAEMILKFVKDKRN